MLTLGAVDKTDVVFVHGFLGASGVNGARSRPGCSTWNESRPREFRNGRVVTRCIR
jgi:hypothetical protein